MNASKAGLFSLALFAGIAACGGPASAQIVALGHSAVRGHVAEGDMWPAVLESLLRARGSRVQVINAGVNGETTGEELARLDRAVPEGTRIVILAINGANDARRHLAGTAEAAANVAAIKRRLQARHIRIIDAMALYISILRQPGMALPDRLHLNAEGCKRMAAALAPRLR
jgi:acyl-CoA thioesterase-1